MSRLGRSLGVGALALVTLFGVACGDDETQPQGAGGAGGGGGAGGAGGAGGESAGVQIPGLSGEVQALYDEHGILHLSCATDDDCFAALGYFHAQNRFFFMDFVRNLVRGRLGSLVAAGDVVLERDYENRRFFSTASGEPLEDKLVADASERVKGHLDAYGRGVNAWIEDMRAGDNGATLTTEYDFGLVVSENIRSWEPQDSAAVGLYVLNDLSNNSAVELSLAAQIGGYDPTLASDLFSFRPVSAAFTQPAGEGLDAGVAPSAPGGGGDASAPGASAALLSEARSRLALVGSGAQAKHPSETGSNNWAVGPGRSASGNALLADDPHLLLTNPSIWFPVELDAVSAGTGEYHVAGSTFPGLPSVMVGHNEKIGWGVTTAYYDLADVYLEELTPDGQAVVFEGGTVPIVERELSFEDAETETTVTQTFRWVPHHGPIISEDLDAGTAITIRWRGHEGGTDLDAFFAVARAQSADEARQAIELVSSSSQNFVVVDVDGNIGWYPYSSVPSRPWASSTVAPWLPLPGDGTAEWGAPVPVADLPQLTNPVAEAIATANQDHTGASADGDPLNDGDDALQAISKAEGTRLRRILDLLDEGGDGHSVDTMTALQGDTYSLYGALVVPEILAIASAAMLTADEQELVDRLSDWTFTCPTGLASADPTGLDDPDPSLQAESIGCTVFHATLFSVVEAALADEIAASGVPMDGERWDLHLVVRAFSDPSSLASGELLWDDVLTVPVETRSDTVLRGLSVAAERLTALGTPNDWRWGRVHRLTLRSIFDSFGLQMYNDGPYAAPGALYTVNVANPSHRELPEEGEPWSFDFRAGPSVRFVVEAHPEGPRMVYQLPGGADLHRESPFYNNLLPRWLDNEPIDFPFGPGAVDAPAVEILVAPAP